MNLSVNDEAMQKVVSAAIMSMLTPETREELVRAAVVKLLTPVKPAYGYGEPKSALSEAFEMAVRECAITTARELMQADGPLKASLRELIAKAVAKLSDDDGVVTRIGEAIASAIARDR